MMAGYTIKRFCYSGSRLSHRLSKETITPLHTTIVTSLSGSSRTLPSSPVDTPQTGLRAKHWFKVELPEGWCVGVQALQSLDEDSGELKQTSLSSLLHEDEYEWGKRNIASNASRTSYYLGRMALRSSLGRMLNQIKTEVVTKVESDSANNTFNSTLWKQIQSTSIMKDTFGRPILPEIIVGSISHKEGCAVGLSRFRSPLSNDTGVEGSITRAVKWKEECPIGVEDDIHGGGNIIKEFGPSTSEVAVGVGVDLERIDDARGRRIQRKVLTEREQRELGGLEVSLCQAKENGFHSLPYHYPNASISFETASRWQYQKVKKLCLDLGELVIAL